jgi:hypothetical protein
MIYFLMPDPLNEPLFYNHPNDDLDEAFDAFVRQHWEDDMVYAVGVWRYNSLVAQILPAYDPPSMRYKPKLYKIPPP